METESGFPIEALGVVNVSTKDRLISGKYLRERKKRERDRERERQTDRRTDRQRDRERE